MQTRYPYLKRIKDCNLPLSQAGLFILYPGMEFGSREKWWPDNGFRPTPHEGIDICYYMDGDGREKTVSAKFQVPVMADGRVAAMCKDFLGYSLFLEHSCSAGHRFLSVYAHILPRKKLGEGDHLTGGEVIGGIADTTGRKNRMVAHLHFTLMLVQRDVSADYYNWDLINASLQAKLIDPLQLLETEDVELRSKNLWKEAAMNDGVFKND